VSITSGVDTLGPSAGNESATITASLLIVADGAQSGLRDSLGISASVKHYAQRAVIANVQTQLPHNGQAFERFVADGAVAFLPLIDLPNSKNRSALVWTMPTQAEGAEDKTLLDDDAFIAELQQAFGHRLGTIQRIGQRQSYPLALTIADEVARNHIVLMGNSAHSLHPVAGQGFNLSLRDVTALVERIGNAIQRQEDIGSLALLEDYAEAQIKDQNLTIGFSHNLIELFGQQSLPVQLGRSIGLLALDLLKPAKERFSDRAAGITGRRSLR
ncbi:MAG: 2-octaprenyl-6-methoxyphenyl hydroxylase, partial [Cellvibrionales bacterium]|nr:2-octaprenyl-6-methoxyphenyl hydroxylase [Cellvibrionales bacterium]